MASLNWFLVRNNESMIRKFHNNVSNLRGLFLA
jgi:hypothetical protein